MPAREVGLPRSRMAQTATSVPRTRTTVIARRTGGSLGARVSPGNERSWAARSWGTRRSHVGGRCFRLHGWISLKEPMSRSSGWTVSVAADAEVSLVMWGTPAWDRVRTPLECARSKDPVRGRVSCVAELMRSEAGWSESGRQNRGGRFSTRAATPSRYSSPPIISSSSAMESVTDRPMSPWRSR